MKIAFSGAQSTGKSTLIKYLKEHNIFKPEVKFIDSVTREIQKKGFKINENSGDDTQNAMIDAHETLLHANVLGDTVWDRCIVDVCAYTWYLYGEGRVSSLTCGRALSSILSNFRKYDLIFYIPPEFDIVQDGVRSDSVTFRDTVANTMEALVDAIDLAGGKVVKLSGTVEERAKQVISAIEKSDLKEMLC